ncbi:hypothetical protein [Nostoc sp.]|uniref:hypothetical protein n=1 Tax=Nostoc sp. TaxID=1180 RepID=UPI0035934B05
MSDNNVQQTAFKDVEVGRDFNFEGDINQIGYQTVVQQKPDFFEPSLERYKSSNFTSPKITSQLIARITKQRFLVLAGSSDVDKESLAKHTVSCLIEELSFSRGEEIITKEWHRSSDPQSIDIELQNTEKTTVFILTQVTPQNVGYDLARIQRAAVLREHYVVISTDITFAAWRQPESIRKFWYELSRESVADCEELINTLSQEDALSNWYHQKLGSRERLLALGLSFFDGLFDDQFFAALEEIVENVWQRRDASLRALDYCDLENLHNFFNFTETKYQGTKIAIRFSKQRRTLFKVAWNSDRRQILSALPVMVDIVTKSVGGRLANPELYGSETKCREIRTAIAETISDIGSISESSIQTTLLQLSANKNTSVQSTAAYAMARWRDPDYGLDQQLFNTLHTWLDLIQARRIIEQVDAILKGRNEESNESSKAEDYIKVTVALTVSYAALYDPPLGMLGSEGLSEELYELLKKLANDNSNVVRDAFINNTLPRVLQIHLRQLSKWLHDTIQKQVSYSSSENSIVKFNKAVARSLALAYTIKSEETREILEKWTEEGLQNLPEYIDISKITSRETLLATVARTYGEIESVEDINQLTPKDIFERLHAIIQREKHPFVREAILFAIGRQARLHFDAIEPQLQSLVGEVKENERGDIVKTLAEIYFEQRINLSGGDYWSSKKFLKIGSTSYPYKYQIWTNEQRPQTPIEEAMYDWIKNARNPVAQQIATRSLVSFANQLDKDEEQEKDRILNNLDADISSQDIKHNTPPTKTSLQDFYVEQIVPWLTIFFKGIQYFAFRRDYYKPLIREWHYYRQVIAGILPEALKQDSSSQSTMDFVLKKLTGLSDKKLEIIANLLKLAIRIAKNPSFVIFCGVLLIILLLWLFIR